MIVATGRGDMPLEVKMDLADWPWSSSPPDSWLAQFSNVDVANAVGVPALLGILLRIGNGVGMLPQLVYDTGPRRATETWQYDLLHRAPSTEATPFQLRGDIAISIAAQGKAFVRKVKGRGGRVRELIVLDARKVKPRRQAGRLVFDDHTDEKPVVRDSGDIIYIRGLAVNGSVEGLAPVTSLRLAVTAALKRQHFEGRYFDNDATPRLIFKFPQGLSAEQAKAYMDAWNAEHQGLENAHKAGAIGGGADVMPLPVSLADAQFVDSMRLTGVQLAGVYGMPLPYLGLANVSPTEADRMQYVTHCLGPYFTVIDQAFNADDDLFPRGGTLFAEHLADALLRPDTRTRYAAYKDARQAGWLTSNEIRGLENYPAHPDGDVLQQTPVGGAPNTDPDAGTD